MVSPSRIWAPIIESPRTLRAKVRAFGLMPMVERSTEIQPDSVSSPLVGRPATTTPRRGIGVNKHACMNDAIQEYNMLPQVKKRKSRLRPTLVGDADGRGLLFRGWVFEGM